MKKKINTKQTEIITGTFEKHQRGFGFVRHEGEEDIFIAPDNTMGAMNGDTVEVDLLPSYLWTKSKEGIITKIVQRKYTEIVGTFNKNKKYGFVVPDDRKNPDDIFIKKDFFRNAQNGDKVVAKILQYGDRTHSAEGKITEIVARAGQSGGDILAMIRSYGLFETFPSRVNAEAKAKSKQGIQEQDIENRSDFRNKNIITIDGLDAKDLDDAVSLDILPNGNYLLGVHIADVSHYVEEGGFLDREALKRGTSVYLINRVVPMLPRALSNGICSLNQGEDRLTLSCIMEIDCQGNVVNHSIEKSVINSKARMVYDDVSDMLENGDRTLIDKYGEIYDELKLMEQLAAILRHKRKSQGSLDFDINEAHITVDEDEVPVSIEPEERRTANKLIEEFMLVTNETVAEHFFWMEYPFVYRVHEKPDPEKLMDLKAYLMNYKIHLKGSPEHIFPKTLADIISQIEGQPYESVVNRVILRTMKKAYYSTQCDGHFGLAFKYYCHFTSPIRRYPDLIIHRIIKQSITGQLSDEKIEKYKADTINASDISSKTEKQAQELEREVEKLKKAQYMLSHIGEIYEGIVSGVTDFGVYVELSNTVEGMAFARDLRRQYTLGESVVVKVIDAKPSEKQIDFMIIEQDKRSET